MAKAKKEEKQGLEATLERLNKKYGANTAVTLDGKITGEYDIISSGSIGMDYQTLGIGGYARGKLYELMAWEGAGKSTLCGHAVVECQRTGGIAAYIDGEHAADKDYLKALGVDTSKLIISQPSTGEEGFNIAMDLVSSGEISLLIIDSDSSLIPKSIIDGEIGDATIGKKARLNSASYPKLKGLLAKYNVCCIVTSQYREKIGVMFGNPTTTQGGHALKFYADCRIELTKSLSKNGEEVIGNTTKAKSIKNKMAPPYKTSKFDIVYGEGIDKFAEVMYLLDEFELGVKWGKTFTYNGEKYDYDEFYIKLREECDFFDSVRELIIKAIKEDNPKHESDESLESDN